MLGLSQAESAGLWETLVELMLIKPEKYVFPRRSESQSHRGSNRPPIPHAFLPFCLLQAVADKYGCVIVIHGLGVQEVHVRPRGAGGTC